MATVAEQLRAAREAKKIPISEVAQITKMRTDRIRALEEGNFDVFAAPVYIRGYVRSYSTLLKLDVEQVMKSLEAELGQTEKFAEPPPLSDSQKGAVDFVTLQLSKVNWRTGGILLGAVAVILVIMWCYSLWKNHRTAEPPKIPPARYQAPARPTDNTLPLTAPTPRK